LAVPGLLKVQGSLLPLSLMITQNPSGIILDLLVVMSEVSAELIEIALRTTHVRTSIRYQTASQMKISKH
jgi:hypothetical protein